MFAPEAVRSLEPPGQMLAGTAEAVTDNVALTVTVTVAVPVQPFKSVPVTVKVWVAAGETLTVAPTKPPGCQS